MREKKPEISVSNKMFQNKTATPICLMLAKKDAARESEGERARKEN